MVSCPTLWYAKVACDVFAGNKLNHQLAGRLGGFVTTRVLGCSERASMNNPITLECIQSAGIVLNWGEFSQRCRHVGSFLHKPKKVPSKNTRYAHCEALHMKTRQPVAECWAQGHRSSMTKNNPSKCAVELSDAVGGYILHHLDG